MNNAGSSASGLVAGSPRFCSGWTWLALLVALVALAGSLWLSLGMELKPCPLCYYQRTFVMAVAGLLAIGLLTRARHSSSLSLLALPAAIGGLGVALYHEYLEFTGKLECPAGIQGLGTAPQQSLAVLALLSLILLLDAVRSGKSQGTGSLNSARTLLAMIVAVALGAGLAVAAVKSVPAPVLPKEAYKTPPDICRPPYTAPPQE